LSHWDNPLGKAVGQADWDYHRLFQLGLGKVKRNLSLSHGTSHIPTLEVFPCPGTKYIPTIELVPVPLVPTCPTKWVYKAVENLIEKPFHGLFSKKKPLKSDSWIQIHELKLRSTSSAEENFADEITWIT